MDGYIHYVVICVVRERRVSCMLALDNIPVDGYAKRMFSDGAIECVCVCANTTNGARALFNCTQNAPLLLLLLLAAGHCVCVCVWLDESERNEITHKHTLARGSYSSRPVARFPYLCNFRNSMCANWMCSQVYKCRAAADNYSRCMCVCVCVFACVHC